MRVIFRIGSAVLLLASIAAVLLLIRQYRFGTRAVQRDYAKTVNNQDTLDSARKAFAAVNDAELRAENYILTGETVYLEAFKEDQRTWEDESGTLTVIARKGHLQALSQDFSESGKRTMDELTAVVALYEKSGRDPAIDRIRKSSSVVYLDQSKKALAGIVEAIGALGGSSRVMSRSLASMKRLTEIAGVLFGIAFIMAILSTLGWRPPPL